MLFTLAASLYFVAVTVFIVSENRRPPSTFAWLFLFIFVPLLGIVIYVLFGRMRGGVGRTRRLLRQDLPPFLEETLARAEAEHGRALARMAEAGSPLALRLATLVNTGQQALVTTSNRVEVVQGARAFYPRLMADVAAARSSVHLQYYIWRADRTGEELRRLLVRKVREGVDVRVIYDPVGSIGVAMFFYIRRLRREGVRMVPFSPLWRVHTISYRNHRKIAVIDGRVGYAGGLNVGCEHLSPGHGFADWRDTHLRLTGLAVRALQGVFAVDWANATRERLLGPEHFPPVEEGEGTQAVQIVVSGPDSDWRAVRQQYFGMVTGARERVRVQTPYFVLDASLTEALRAAALGGVDVSLMVTEAGPDQRLVYWAAQTYFAEIAGAGVEVLLYQGGFLHAKTAVADGRVASVGSGNWDIRSFSINYELNVLVYDEAVAAAVEAGFERDRARCRRFDPEAYRALPRPRRFRDSLARLAGPIL